MAWFTQILLHNYLRDLYETWVDETRQAVVQFATEIVSVAVFVLGIWNREPYLFIRLCMNVYVY